MLIFRFVAPLCYTNVDVFKSRLAKVSGINPALCGNKTQLKGCLQLASEKVHIFVCTIICLDFHGYLVLLTMFVRPYFSDERARYFQKPVNGV